MTRDQAAAVAAEIGTTPDIVAAVERALLDNTGHHYSRHDNEPGEQGQPGARVPLRYRHYRGSRP